MTAPEATEPTLEDRAGEQHRNGWGPIPLPTERKAPPPDGFTGQKNPRPSFADWYTLVQENPDRWGNLGARIPIGVVGIDVDAYGGKHGLETWKALGGDFPETVVLSSRFGPGYDGASGIRFYRLPDEVDQSTLWGAHDGIEILRYGHRYAVSPGSTHPEGGMYRLVDMRSKQFLDVLPHVLDLPELPVDLAMRLTDAGAPWAGDAPIAREPDAAPPCRYTMTLLTRALSALASSSSRFDTMRDAVWALVSGEDEGHHLGIALDTLGLAYVAVTKADREAQHAEPPGSEFARAVAGARAKVDANPTDDMFKACCLSHDEPLPAPPEALAVANTEPDALELQPDESEELTAYDRVVRARYAELRVNEDAKVMLAVHKMGEIAPVEPIGLADFLAQPDEEIEYRVEGLWPRQGRVLLAAAAKSGKTTMVTANLIPSLVDGRPFLGRHAVEPVAGTVVLFNMEVGEPVLRRWLRGSGIHHLSKVVVVNLRGKASTLTLSTDKGRKRIVDMLLAVRAEVVILDPLAPVLATLGLDENSNADVATFFSWWSEVMGAAGVHDDMVVHHTGHAGQRSRGASRLLDEPDAVWTLTRDKDDEDELEGLFDAPMRYLSAYGRDVEMRTEGLDYEPDTHALVLNGQEKGKTGDKYERRVLDLMSDGLPRSQNAMVETCTGAPRTLWPAVKSLIARGALEDTGATGKGGGSLYVLPPK